MGCSGNHGVSQSQTRLSPSSSYPRHSPRRDGDTSSKSHVRECSQQLYLQPPEARLPWVHPPRCPERRSNNHPEHLLEAILSRTSHHDKLQAFPPKAVSRQRHRQSQKYCDFPLKYCFCSLYMIRGVSDVLRICYKLDPKAALRSEVRPQQQLLGFRLPSFFPPPTPRPAQPAPPAAPSLQI